MKSVVLILSKTFPVWHRRRGRETGFIRSLESGRKIHTIRAGYDRWKHNLDKVIDGDFTLSVREWSGRPYNSTQEERAKYRGKEVGYQRIVMFYEPQGDKLEVLIDGKPFNDIKTLAANDGLTVPEFVQWMFPGSRYGTMQAFDGIIIHFTGYRY